MDEIPIPEVLDPDRLLTPERDDLTLEEHRTRAQAAVSALREACDYGQTLHRQLSAAREYLADHVPASKDDDAAWNVWGNLYSSLTSSLAGPHGDSGFGEDEAKLLAQNHRAG